MKHRPPLLPVVFLGGLLLAIPSCGREGAKGGRPSVLVVVVDTLRADRLSSYGFEGEDTPALSALADAGMLFRHALAASPWTGPSVSAIVTGKYPDEIGIHDKYDPLPTSVPNLAERLGRAGYATAAVFSNAFAGPSYGHTRGYDRFHFERYKGSLGGAQMRPLFTADRVTDRAVAWLKENEADDAPFYLYVHYTDPHEPYLPPPKWREPHLEGHSPVSEELLLERAFTHAALTSAQVDTIRAQYQAEIAFADHEIGRLLEHVPANTVVVVVGDHGEEFLEHGGFLHGHSLFQELLHVPLLLRGPGVPEGVAEDEPVSHVDILPTLLELTGLDAVEGETVGGWGLLAGQSLTRFFPGKTGPNRSPRPLFAVFEHEGADTYAVRRGAWKLHYDAATSRTNLFDLDSDPGETTDVAPQHPAVVAELLELHAARTGRIVEGDRKDVDPASREQREAELRAIGYVK